MHLDNEEFYPKWKKNYQKRILNEERSNNLKLSVTVFLV